MLVPDPHGRSRRPGLGGRESAARANGWPLHVSAKPVLAIALLLVLGLAAWRGIHAADGIAQSQAAATSPIEYALEPMVGAGHVRAVRGGSPASVLVLLDSESALTAQLSADRIGTLLAAAGLYDPLAGETLTVQRIPFAQALSPQQRLETLIELALLGSVAALLAWALAQKAPAPTALVSAITPPAQDSANLSMTGHKPGPRTAPREASDPDAVVALVRKWLKEDAA